MINRRVSLFYRYLLESSHHIVCPCTLYSACVVRPGTSELIGQHNDLTQAHSHTQRVQICSHWSFLWRWIRLGLQGNSWSVWSQLLSMMMWASLVQRLTFMLQLLLPSMLNIFVLSLLRLDSPSMAPLHFTETTCPLSIWSTTVSLQTGLATLISSILPSETEFMQRKLSWAKFLVSFLFLIDWPGCLAGFYTPATHVIWWATLSTPSLWLLFQFLFGYIFNTNLDIYWQDEDTKQLKLAAHARFDEGINNLPVDKMLPNVQLLSFQIWKATSSRIDWECWGWVQFFPQANEQQGLHLSSRPTKTAQQHIKCILHL